MSDKINLINKIGDYVERMRPKMDAVIIQYVDGKPFVSIEMINEENLPTLQKWAQNILKSGAI